MYRLQWSTLGPEDVFLLERCPHFRGCYVQASVELGQVYVHTYLYVCISTSKQL